MTLREDALLASALVLRSTMPDVRGSWRVFGWVERFFAGGPPVAARSYGCNFVLDMGDLVDRRTFWQRIEKESLGVWRSIAVPGAVVFDVGANIGVYSLVAAKGGAHVYAFEPNPPTLKRLRVNLAANPIGTPVVLIEQAVSDREGTAMLFDDGNAELPLHNRGMASLSSLNATGVGRTVTTTTLDRVVESAGLTRLDGIKMDIQGAELMALRGARQTLRSLRPRVIMEFEEPAAKNLGWTRADLDEFLIEVGYRCRNSLDWGNLLLEPLPLDGTDMVAAVAIGKSAP